MLCASFIKSFSTKSRDAFESGVLASFALAFASLLGEGQYAGLYGTRGILPVSRQLNHHHHQSSSSFSSSSSSSFLARTRTTLAMMRETGNYNCAWLARVFFPAVDESCDTFMEGVLWVGLMMSLWGLVVCGGGGGGRKAYHFAALVWMYGSMVDIGDAFMSFQWDVLLLECGIGCAIGAAIFPRDGTFADDAAYAWIPRAILYKLMLMSGCVKIQSHCKTWLNLTALEYHFATQPLPNGFSRLIANGTSPRFKRIGVALTYLVEGPLAFLIIAPTKMARRGACLAQILFQIGIMLSGNYAYFNLLTIVLAMASFAGEERKMVEETTTTAKTKNKEKKESKNAKNNEEEEEEEEKEKYAGTLGKNKAKALPVLQHSIAMIGTHLSLLFFIICTVNMFAPGKDGVKLRPSPKKVNKQLQKFLDVAVPVSRMYLILVAVPLTHAYRTILSKATMNSDSENSKKMTRLARFTLRRCRDVFLMAYLLVITAPMQEIAPNKRIAKARPLLRANAQFLDTATNSIQQHVPTCLRHITSGYGLFRTMTGVGDDGKRGKRVARPEIIFEIAPDAKTVEDLKWTELEFKHKPGDVRKRPSFVAPHQPRLDWQMWFAALRGDGVFRDPRYKWFSMFIIRILQKSPEVWNILDPSMQKHMETTTYLRASMYEYDFAPKKEEGNDAVYVRKNLGTLLPPTRLDSPEIEGLRNMAGPIDYEKDMPAFLNIPDVDAVTFAVSVLSVMFASLIYNTRRGKMRRRKEKVR